MTPTIDALTIADDAEDWRTAGFTVDDDGTCRIGTVRLELVGRDGSNGKRGIRRWSLRDAPRVTGGALITDLDGIRTTTSKRLPPEPAQHPNGSQRLDHLVITSADGATTAAAFEAGGWPLRRVRDADNFSIPMQQRFFRAGEVILELVAPTTPTHDRPTRLYGLAMVVADLEATARALGGLCNPIKDAVQPGRQLATLRTRDLDLSVPIIFMTP
ncbi:MAG TPA: hypothetical protein VHA73_00150 [Acidimicrobiales bacterium]|nr:hypothetical protein [Acidimicrobiales bacterium]